MAEGLLRIPQDEAGKFQHDACPCGAPLSPSSELPLPALLLVAALAAALVAPGGYYGSGQRLVAVLVSAAAVLALGAWRPSIVARHPISRVCAALAGWSVASAALAGDWTSAVSTVLVLAGAVVVVLTCARLDVEQRDQLATAVVGLGVVVALSGWAGVAWHKAPLALEDQGLWRAATTLTYANAAAGFLAVVALLSLARSTGSPPSGLHATATLVLLTGLGATLSRGGFVALSSRRWCWSGSSVSAPSFVVA